MLHKEVEIKDTVLEVQGMKKYFPVKNSLGIIKGQVKAVDDLSFTLREGETFGLVGESGCGKSTTGRTLLRLTNPTEGKAFFENRDIFKLTKKELQRMRQQFQMVFQDPYSSLNPRKRIGSILEEPLKIQGVATSVERTNRAMDILNKVGLRSEHYYRFPNEFSGGQRQRIGLARALMLNPKILVCDEPVSALDVSVQSQIINLLRNLQSELNLSFLFIAHDISVVRHISDRIGIMYLGKMVEESYTDSLINNPLHPYTQALLSSIPNNDPNVKRDRIVLKGEIPSPINPPRGCVFHTRCQYAMEVCKTKAPESKEIEPGHLVSCHLY